MTNIFVDITTTTPNTTAIKRGDYNIAECRVSTFAKDSGTSTGFNRGYALSRTESITPNVFAVTSTKVAEQVVVSGLPLAYIPTNVNYQAKGGGAAPADGSGEDVSALDEDVAFTGVMEGPVCVYITGAIQPGHEVMTAANGEFAAYDGSGTQYIKGVFLGKAGQVSDARQVKQAIAAGGLGIVYLQGAAK